MWYTCLIKNLIKNGGYVSEGDDEGWPRNLVRYAVLSCCIAWLK